MEKQLNCNPLLSLKEMTLRRITILLWSDRDTLASIGKLQKYDSFPVSSDQGNKGWRSTFDAKVEDKINNLDLPISLRELMIGMVRPIGLQINRWKDFHLDYLSLQEFNVPVLANLHWTSAGGINYRETAKALVCRNVLNNENSYQLASLYCLENYLPLLWKNVHKFNKRYYYKEVPSFYSIQEPLRFCWPHILAGNPSKLISLWTKSSRNWTSFNQCAFENSAEIGNKAAAEYFFPLLTFEEREVSILRTAQKVLDEQITRPYRKWRFRFPKEKLSDVFFYLLSLMTSEQSMKIFKEQPIHVLVCFLDWPWQDAFLEKSRLLRPFFPTEGYRILLLYIFSSAIDSQYYFPEIFQGFFKQHPFDFKNFVTERHSSGVSGIYGFCPILSTIFRFKDSETLRVIFSILDDAERLKLLLFPGVLEVLLTFYEMDMEELCIREAKLSNESWGRLKKAFHHHINQGRFNRRKMEKMERLFEVIDGIHESS